MRGYGPIRFLAKGELHPAGACLNFGGHESIQLVREPRGRLAGRLKGTACPTNRNPNVYRVQALVRITESGGRFDGTAGSWFVTGTLNAATGAFDHVLHGQLTGPR